LYSINKTSYGIRIIQKGIFTIDEVEKYKIDVIRILSSYDKPFSILIDSRELVLPNEDVLKVFDQLFEIVWGMSCERGAIVIKSPVAKRMVDQACCNAPIKGNDRIINAEKFPNWDKIAVAWVADGIEPPLKQKEAADIIETTQ